MNKSNDLFAEKIFSSLILRFLFREFLAIHFQGHEEILFQEKVWQKNIEAFPRTKILRKKIKRKSKSTKWIFFVFSSHKTKVSRYFLENKYQIVLLQSQEDLSRKFQDDFGYFDNLINEMFCWFPPLKFQQKIMQRNHLKSSLSTC